VRYRITCLTPTLVGDGQKLAPIDYMVWRDQVNVLDQRRIFKLLAKGPRLDSYLSQLKRSEKLDFASWGGFAQNFAGRRIPFEHPALTASYERERAENLFIPTFASTIAGPYLPGAAIKGALRTGAIAGRWSHATMEQVAARLQTEKVWRRVASYAEADALGASGADRMRFLQVVDSAAASPAAMKIYLLRVATLVARGQRYELGWKTSPRGTVDGRRPEDSTPLFAEMAPPGTVFEGEWRESEFLKQPEIARALHWKHPDRRHLLEFSNRFAEGALALHARYAEEAGLSQVAASVADLRKRLAEIRNGRECLLSIGWGGGFHSKAPYLDTQDETYRSLLRQLPFYARAIQTGLPFPKTRRVVFLGNQPAALPGWVLLEVESSS
jgi:CRISPR-associated protein Csm5